MIQPLMPPAIYKETVRCVRHPAPASTSPLYTPCFWWCTRTFPQNHQSKTHAPNPCICRQARTEARCTDCCRQGCTSCCCLDLNTWQALLPLLCVFHYHQYQYMYWHGHHCGCTLRLEQGAGAYIEHARGYDCRCGVGCLRLLWSRLLVAVAVVLVVGVTVLLHNRLHHHLLRHQQVHLPGQPGIETRSEGARALRIPPAIPGGAGAEMQQRYLNATCRGSDQQYIRFLRSFLLLFSKFTCGHKQQLLSCFLARAGSSAMLSLALLIGSGVFCSGQAPDPVAPGDAIVSFGEARFTVLSPSLIRLEYVCSCY